MYEDGKKSVKEDKEGDKCKGFQEGRETALKVDGLH